MKGNRKILCVGTVLIMIAVIAAGIYLKKEDDSRFQSCRMKDGYEYLVKRGEL